MKHRLLVVDDEQSLRQFLTLFLQKEGYEVDVAASRIEAEKTIRENVYDLVITDMRMAAEDDGLRILRAAIEMSPSTQVIVLTAFGTIEGAVEAMKLGAYNYIVKPFNNQDLRDLIRGALASRETAVERRRALRQEIQGKSSFEGIVGRSEAMLMVYELIDRVAPTNANVMILGESGTGKELIASALHARSERKDAPFIAINCAAIPETLMESELFGHMRGAFTGAVQTKRGLFEAAHKGTLFLDEVGEIPANMQSKLLRAIQERVFRRIGGNEDISIDVRIVCASKRKLEEEMKAGRFRDDLYFRLNVIQIVVPSLRERREDIPVLAQHFLDKYAKLMGKPIARMDGGTMRSLLAYDYPGNVRELENIMERATIIETKDVISIASLPQNVTKIDSSAGEAAVFIPEAFDVEGSSLDTVVDRLEKELLLKALERSGGNRTEAAKLLNISFRSMRYRLDKHGIE
ncbi:MAG: sigma-54-dependent Fis family transcriptional regulator [Deltaproteobacteria bacterium]|nr:sigma-54-dependent Fis family transcriptional regulator [Deltaproteobacteria bacterium]